MKPPFLERLRGDRKKGPQVPPTASPNWALTFLPALLSLVGGLFGGFLGNAGLEATKSADSLRRFVLVESYRPLRDSFISCGEKRAALVIELQKGALMVGTASAALEAIDINSDAPPAGLSGGLEAAVKSFNEVLQRIGTLQGETKFCSQVVISRVDELAILLNIGPQVGELRRAHSTKISERVKGVGGATPKLDEYMSDPTKVANLLRAGVDGASGNLLRAKAAFSRLKTLVAEFHTMLDADARYHAIVLQQEQAFSADLAGLVMADLNRKFSRTFREMLFDSW
jgi:hypothetical protein